MAKTVDEREAWLAQVNEDPIEPGLPIVDPHHHLWDHPGSRYMLDEILPAAGALYVMDRGYVDFARLYIFTSAPPSSSC